MCGVPCDIVGVCVGYHVILWGGLCLRYQMLLRGYVWVPDVIVGVCVGIPDVIVGVCVGIPDVIAVVCVGIPDVIVGYV